MVRAVKRITAKPMAWKNTFESVVETPPYSFQHVTRRKNVEREGAVLNRNILAHESESASTLSMSRPTHTESEVTQLLNDELMRCILEVKWRLMTSSRQVVIAVKQDASPGHSSWFRNDSGFDCLLESCLQGSMIKFLLSAELKLTIFDRSSTTAASLPFDFDG